MANPYEHEDIVVELRLMIHRLRDKGIIPCSELDIIDGKLPYEKNQLFLSYGIDLILAVKCFPLDPTIPLVKLEDTYLLPSEFSDSNSNTTRVKLEDTLNAVKLDPEASFDQDWSFEPLLDNLKEEYESDSEDEEEYKPKRKRKSKAKSIPKTKAKSKLEKVSDSEDVSKYEPRRCKECKITFETHEEYFVHRSDHLYSSVKGIKTRLRNFEYIAYVPEKHLLEKKEEFKDQAVIQIPPPDFTKEIASKCTFPKPVREYLVDDFKKKWKKARNGVDMRCSACPTKLNNLNEVIDHHLKCHKVKFKCPVEDCKYPINKYFVDFAKHYFYHNEPLPQLKYPHECIACDFSTPMLDKIEAHVKTMGKYHNNKCPKCDLRFSSRSEMARHVLIEGHQSCVCGWCGQTFQDENKLIVHKKSLCKENPNKANGEICDICGKTVKNVTTHKITKHSKADDPQICSDCKFVCKNKQHLELHKKDCATARKGQMRIPCTQCGQMVRQQYMKNHTLNNHTPEHMKPYVCDKCGKGFMQKDKLDDHMNIHFGIKPHACKYACGATFRDFGNKRMHERCAHEGHSRK